MKDSRHQQTQFTDFTEDYGHTEPLVDFYRERGKLVVVEGQEEVADTTRLLLEKLGVSL